MPNAMILKKTQRCTYTKTPAATRKTEKLDGDKKKTKDAKREGFEELPEMYVHVHTPRLQL